MREGEGGDEGDEDDDDDPTGIGAFSEKTRQDVQETATSFAPSLRGEGGGVDVGGISVQKIRRRNRPIATSDQIYTEVIECEVSIPQNHWHPPKSLAPPPTASTHVSVPTRTERAHTDMYRHIPSDDIVYLYIPV